MSYSIHKWFRWGWGLQIARRARTRVAASILVAVVLAHARTGAQPFYSPPPVIPVPVLRLPDLAINSVDLARPLIQRSGAVWYPARIVIQNRGNLGAGEFYMAPIYFTVPGGDVGYWLRFSNDTTGLGYRFASLAAGATQVVNAFVVIPAQHRGRTVAMRFEVDSWHQVRESNEDNFYSPPSVTVPR